jgi:hypothetical protein
MLASSGLTEFKKKHKVAFANGAMVDSESRCRSEFSLIHLPWKDGELCR